MKGLFSTNMSLIHAKDHIYNLICWAWQAEDWGYDVKQEFDECCHFIRQQLIDNDEIDALERMIKIVYEGFIEKTEFTMLSRILSKGRSGKNVDIILNANKYSDMQEQFYNHEASLWDEDNLDMVVGMFNDHNIWPGYDNLFRKIDNKQDKIILDFACGPGRNIVKYKDVFKRIDGVDISCVNIENAKQYTSRNGVDCNLYVCNGFDLSDIESDKYDIVMSTIALQHICVHSIRFNYLKEFFRILKPGGSIAIQMGYGTPSPFTVDYYADHFEAFSTNRRCDTEIKNPEQVENDLIKIGFHDFSCTIDKTGPGDGHPHWIYFNAQKPI